MKLPVTVLTAAIVFLSANPAFALSCSQSGYDLKSVIEAKLENDKNVVYAIGRFSGKLPKKRTPAPKSYSFKQQFEGVRYLNGNISKLSGEITARVNCFDPWCGQTPPHGKDVIVIFDVTEKGQLLFNSQLCRQTAFDGDLSTLKAALK